MNIILECLLKWFAPILVFTTEEIFSLVEKSENSIHEQNYHLVPDKWKNDKLDRKWKKLFEIKQKANIAIEEKRANKEIGSSLEAQIQLTVGKNNYNILDDLDLAEYFITSKANRLKSQNENEITIKVSKVSGKKCPRCWKILEKNCNRCDEILKQ